MPSCEDYDIDPVNAAIASAIAVSGVATFVTTYNAASGINELELPCVEDSELKEKLKVRSYVYLALGGTAIVIGIIIGFITKKNDCKPGLSLSIGFGLAGLLFLLGGLNNVMETHVHKYLPLGLSWGLFVALVAFGIYRFFNPGDTGNTDV